MSNLAVTARGLSKRYRIGARQEAYRTLRDSIMLGLRSPWNRFRSFITRDGQSNGTASNYIWALDGVSFDVKHGEVLGIIGRNGAGKSTLLKILSRITEPTGGYAQIHGRMGSLLEVGTGFHPELTGRENIYLNGVILGMKNAEITRKFDQIVDFAEVEKFIDTPVKFYSSGMYLRLAFSVAAHLEPEILVVDEVLAVGDAAFQKKCTGLMGQVARDGRTVLFVSHNLAAVRQLCTSALLLVGGQVEMLGRTEEVLRSYLDSAHEDSGGDLTQVKDRKGTGNLRFSYIRFEDESGLRTTGLASGQSGRIVLGVAANRTFRDIRACIAILDGFQQKIMYLKSTYVRSHLASVGPGMELICEIPRVHLAPGRYRLEIWMSSGSTLQDHVNDATELTITDGNFFGTGEAVSPGFQVALMDYTWRAREAQEGKKVLSGPLTLSVSNANGDLRV